MYCYGKLFDSFALTEMFIINSFYMGLSMMTRIII